MGTATVSNVKSLIAQLVNETIKAMMTWPEDVDPPASRFDNGHIVNVGNIQADIWYDEASRVWRGFFAIASIPGVKPEMVGYHFIDIEWNTYALPEIRCSLLGKETYRNKPVEARKILVHMGLWQDGRVNWFFLNRKNKAKHVCPECKLRPVEKEGEACLRCRSSLSVEEIKKRRIEIRIKRNSQVLSNGGIWYYHEVRKPYSTSPVHIYYLFNAEDVPADFVLPQGAFGSSVHRYRTTFEGRPAICYEITFWND